MYGGSITGWLEIPVGLLRIFAERLDRRSAERQLDALAAVRAGSGKMRPEDEKQYVADLRRLAGAAGGRKIKTVEDAQAVGLKVEIEEPAT